MARASARPRKLGDLCGRIEQVGCPGDHEVPESRGPLRVVVARLPGLHWQAFDQPRRDETFDKRARIARLAACRLGDLARIDALVEREQEQGLEAVVRVEERLRRCAQL